MLSGIGSSGSGLVNVAALILAIGMSAFALTRILA
jgi:hypothetical protein